MTETVKKRKRVGLWLFLALQVIFLLWVILGAVSGHHTAVDCHGLNAADCTSARNARDTGTAIGVGLIVGVWAAVDIVIGVTYALVRLVRR